MGAQEIHILVVEDDEIDSEAVRRLLGRGYVVTAVETGADARRAIAASAPDAVLLDYRLPDVEGLALLPEIVEQFIPVILLTGEDRPQTIVSAMQRGAQDFLVKGYITHDVLERAIGNAIEKVALRRGLAEQQEQLAAQAAALEESNRHVRSLASALTLAEQRERRRISQILHDHVQQMLYGIQMRNHLLDLDIPDTAKTAVADHLAEIEQLVEKAIHATRTLTVELSPPVLQNEGLGSALSWLANQMAQLHDLDVNLDMRQDYQLPDEDLRVLIFQLARELLFNVVKHAQVNEAGLALYEADGQLHLCVEDDGIGFDASKLAEHTRAADPGQHQHGGPGSFGLYSIRERLGLFGGELVIDSQPQQGTRVELILPLDVCADKHGATDQSVVAGKEEGANS